MVVPVVVALVVVLVPLAVVWVARARVDDPALTAAEREELRGALGRLSLARRNLRVALVELFRR